MGSTQLKSDRLSGAEVSSLESLLQQTFQTTDFTAGSG